MIPIARSEGIRLFSPDKKRFSFFNSPYPSHRQHSGLDIYPSGQFGDTALSPLDGVVKEIRFVQTPPAPAFQKHRGDFVLLIESAENPDRWLKILHVDPCVKTGQAVKKGDPIGQLIRSGFFGYSTPPHMHLEVRHPEDSLRAGGGYRIERIIPVPRQKPVQQLTGTISQATPRYLLVAPAETHCLGIPCETDGIPALLDGGIPHYSWFGIHTEQPLTLAGQPVALAGKIIGRIESSCHHAHLAKSLAFEFRLGHVTVGCSFHLYPNVSPSLYIVPLSGEKRLGTEGDSVTITIHPKEQA